MTSAEIGFDSKRYLELQSAHIKERMSHFGKLYLEFGGKLFDDYHASRVLPGFAPDIKLQMLEQLKDKAEIVIVIGADAIEQNKIRGDLGITYDDDALRLKKALENRGFYVSSIVITKYTGQPAADHFRQRLEQLGIRCYLHYVIEGYPSNIPLILSSDGYGRNQYIETTRELVVVTAPGPGSGKMATRLSQVYQEHQRGVKAGYAKFETFPIWNLPLKHPVNLAYEAATADLADVNMIDPFHLEAYGKTTVNYNRDVEIFPVLQQIFQGIMNECPYKSPTDMGVNMAGFAICNDDACRRASQQEIIRRYYASAVNVRKGLAGQEELYKQELLLKQAGVTSMDRPVAVEAQKRAEELQRAAPIAHHVGDLDVDARTEVCHAEQHAAGVHVQAVAHRQRLGKRLRHLSGRLEVVPKHATAQAHVEVREHLDCFDESALQHLGVNVAHKGGCVAKHGLTRTARLRRVELTYVI